MEYGIGRVFRNPGDNPFLHRVEIISSSTVTQSPVGIAFCLGANDAIRVKEGDVVLVKFIPDDQFCTLINLDELRTVLNTPPPKYKQAKVLVE